MDYRFGARFTFGINTFYNTEVSDGSLDPEVIRMDNINTDQWVEAALKARMKYCLFTVKHPDGFCNWNTDHSYYNIMNTPFNRDLLEMVADSCRRKGLKLGLYYSLWDAYVSYFDLDQKYFHHMLAQVEELLTKYGDIASIWFDGGWKKQTNGWDLQPEAFIYAWRKEGAFRYRMDYLYRMIREWQPDCIVLNNPTNELIGVPLHPVDARTAIDVAAVVVDRKYWRWLGEEIYLPWEITINLSGKNDGRFDPGFWFFRDGDFSVPDKETVKRWLRFTERHEANLVLNCPITPEGSLRPQDEELLRGLWEEEGLRIED